jgi:hypothetical protein
MTNDGPRYSRMCQAARKELPATKYSKEQSQLLGAALEVAREYEHVNNKRQFKWIVKRELKRKVKGQYTFITWQLILWWILPKLIEWFVVWWFQDKAQSERFNQNISQALNNSLYE